VADVLVGPDGTVRFIHDDDIAEALADVGPATVRRASHVEPDGAGRWYADMAPVGGPLLEGFSRRDEALRAERVWLEANGIPVCVPCAGQDPRPGGA